MADNVAITPGTGETIAADEVGGAKYQRIKLAHGADGSATDVSSASPLPVIQRASTPTLSNVAASATSVTLLAANTSRRSALVFNDSSSRLYLKFGSAASVTSFTTWLEPYQLYELPLPVYDGIITGLWTTATGTARVTEVV